MAKEVVGRAAARGDLDRVAGGGDPVTALDVGDLARLVGALAATAATVP